ncbi:Rve domain-containing protein [Cocos nucifera]|uniref:Rve domain-containing protein n=1 Tax=Cocos nucifera TaxID=13894 RepID=A0A8K0ND61_COCNU|nr:Rve domain-containing protein [Cocos nucifera]
MHDNYVDYVRRCNRCQRNANVQRQSATELAPLSAPWSFAQWRMDILGSFPMASGQQKFLLVTIDYFTKWVKAEPLTKITEAKVQDFIWKSVICRFGLPQTIIIDNGRQFAGVRFVKFCEGLNIFHHFTSVAHSQAMGKLK